MPTATITYRGQEVQISLDPMIACHLHSLRSQASGASAVYDLGLLALGAGWPSPPWMAAPLAVLAAAEGRVKALVSEQRGRGDQLSKGERAELRSELQAAQLTLEVAKADLRAADTTDISLTPSEASAAAGKIKAYLLDEGVPPLQIGSWCGVVLRLCGEIATAGAEAWYALEASGFSTPQAANPPSGGSGSLVANAATHHAGGN